MNTRNIRKISVMLAACGISLLIRRIAPAEPSLGGPVLGVYTNLAQLSLVNCDDTNFNYVLQTSTDLLNWISYRTNSATPTGSLMYAVATNPACYYRLMVISNVPQPLFNYAILTRSNFNINGSTGSVDSFDSSDPLYSTAGQYDLTKRKAGGNIATISSVVNAIFVGNGNIYGSVFTGPGTAAYFVGIGANGAVGDVAWNANNSGIQPGHWAGGLFANLPSVQTPTFSGDALPPADTNGIITLNGGYYIAPTNPAAAFNITGPTTLWVQGSFIPYGITIAQTNAASLVVYLGTATGVGDTLNLNNGNAMNQPGFAQNLQFYALPSISNIMFSATRSFVGTMYAPDANATISGGGTNLSLVSGALIVKSVTLNSHVNVHFDEHLKISGPTR